MKCI